MKLRKIMMAKYEAYVRICRVARKFPMDFSEFMVSKGYGYDPIDKCWVLC